MPPPIRNRHPTPRAEHTLSPQTRTRVRWYRHTRAWLLFELGGRCVDCGTSEELEFDELVPRPPGMPAPNRTSRWQRLRNYIKLWRTGQTRGERWLAIRCRTHNAQRGEGPPATPYGTHTYDTDPF